MVVVAQLVRALVCGSRGRRFEPGLPPFDPSYGGVFSFFRNKNELKWHIFCLKKVKKQINYTVMFTLFKASPKFPKVQPLNVKFIQRYFEKFEESIKTFEELQKESVSS